MNEKLTIGYLYKEQLNLYGDNGNVEILTQRAQKRDIRVEVVVVDMKTAITDPKLKEINLMFMGGGSDYSQRDTYQDFYENKRDFLKDYVESGKAGLYICGSYQLMGNYYKSADGSILQGLEIFDIYTEHFGYSKQRCLGNVVVEIADQLLEDPVFKAVNKTGSTLVGFENHGGRTYLGENLQPLGRVKMGFGNNGEDKTEGIYYKNSIGTYLHGPVLARNPHLADYLIATSLNLSELPLLDDDLIKAAHTASKKLKQ